MFGKYIANLQENTHVEMSFQWSVFSCKFAAYFQNIFLDEHVWRTASTSFCEIDENSKFKSFSNFLKFWIIEKALEAFSSSPSCSNEHNIDMQMEITKVNTTISTQTEDMNITKDKCVGSTVKDTNIKTQYKTEHFVQTNHDLHDTKVLEVKIWKKKTRDKSVNTDFSFRPNEIISFTEYDSYDEDDESDTEMTTHIQDVLDTSYIPSDEMYESSTFVTTESE